jgi:hypothetical protein
MVRKAAANNVAFIALFSLPQASLLKDEEGIKIEAEIPSLYAFLTLFLLGLKNRFEVLYARAQLYRIFSRTGTDFFGRTSVSYAKPHDAPMRAGRRIRQHKRGAQDSRGKQNPHRHQA